MKTTRHLLLTLFLLAPATALAIHDNPGQVKCLDCHYTLPFDREKLSYSEAVEGACKSCHAKFHGQDSADSFNHPIGVLPSMKVPLDMPLNRIDQMTCITCHAYHAEFWEAENMTGFLLRRPRGKKLCHSCHQNF